LFYHFIFISFLFLYGFWNFKSNFLKPSLLQFSGKINQWGHVVILLLILHLNIWSIYQLSWSKIKVMITFCFSSQTDNNPYFSIFKYYIY
jgi:hypothetical protein